MLWVSTRIASARWTLRHTDRDRPDSRIDCNYDVSFVNTSKLISSQVNSCLTGRLTVDNRLYNVDCDGRLQSVKVALSNRSML